MDFKKFQILNKDEVEEIKTRIESMKIKSFYAISENKEFDGKVIGSDIDFTYFIGSGSSFILILGISTLPTLKTKMVDL